MPVGGNHWSDWTGPDANVDGIVDSPKTIAGFAPAAQDNYPWVLQGGWLQTFGSGTVGSPYIIRNVTGLQAMQNSLNAYYALGNDIDASETKNWNGGAGFVPVGTNANRFGGSLDGRNHTITGLHIYRPITDDVGLFGYATLSPSFPRIDNLKLVGSNITGRAHVGSFFGYGSYFTVSNCQVEGKVTASSGGGFVGYIQTSGVVSHSSFTGTISGDSQMGGAVGQAASTSLDNVYVKGTVTGTGTGQNIGGLVGYLSGTSPIKNCHVAGDVQGIGQVGGLVGYSVNSGPVISNSSSSANVISSNYGAGGLVGTLYQGSVTNSYATGNVTRSSGTQASFGGFVGYNNAGKIFNSYSTGAVYESPGMIWAAGDKGFAGLLGAGYLMTGNYWDTETSQQSASAGMGAGQVEGRTTLEMMSQTTFVGWDFSTAWWMNPGNTRPFLKVEWNATIRNSHQLQLMAMNFGAIYKLACDIDLSDITNPAQMWGTSTVSGAGFLPVGTSATRFIGTLEGSGYKLSNIYIKRPTTDYFGLFGYVGATGKVYNLTLENAYVEGRAVVGGLVGYNYGLVRGVTVSGTVMGNSNTGGIVGWNEVGTITRCTNLADVTTSTNNAGGIVGYNNGPLSESYSSGTINSANFAAGGIAGVMTANIANCYAVGDVYATDTAGGLIGTITGGTLSNSYSSGFVNGATNLGGLVGSNSGTVTNSFWDTQTSGRGTSAGGTGRVTSAMMTQSTFTGWDFSNTWWMVDTQTRPFLRMEWGREIRNSHQLQMMQMNLGADYVLGCDIDLSDIIEPAHMWGTSIGLGAGFMPVGDFSPSFTGSFDGLNHVVNGLYINRPTKNSVALFGYIGTGAVVSNVGTTNHNVTGNQNVGGVVGDNRGTVSNCHAAGAITGNLRVGGLVGINYYLISNSYSMGYVNGTVSEGSGIGGALGENTAKGKIFYSYSSADVRGLYDIGGFVGSTVGTVSDCYATGKSTRTSGAMSQFGGFVGSISATGKIFNSYSIGRVIYEGTSDPTTKGFCGAATAGNEMSGNFWDKETSLQTSTGGTATGLTTAEMKTMATFTGAGWDFDTIWQMQNGVTYPYFRKPVYIVSEEEPASTQVYQNLTAVTWDSVNSRFWISGEHRPDAASTVYYIDGSDYTKLNPVSGTPSLSFQAIAADHLGNILVGGNGIAGLHYYNGASWIEVKNGSSMSNWNITGITFNNNDRRFYIVGNDRSSNDAVAFFTDSAPLTAGSKLTKDTNTFLSLRMLRSVAWNQKSSKNYSLAVGDGVYRMAYNGTGNSLNWSVIQPPGAGVTYYDVCWDAWGNVTEQIPTWDQAAIVGSALNLTDGFYHGNFWRYYDSNTFFGVRHTDPNPGRYVTCAIKPPASPLYLYTFPDSGGGWMIEIASSYEGGEVTLNLNKPQIFSVQMYKSSDITQTNLLNKQVDADSTYTFMVEYNYIVSGDDRWNQANISLIAWFDEGLLPGEVGYSEPSDWNSLIHRTRQFCLNYSMKTKSFQNYYPDMVDGLSEFSIQNVWEDPTIYGGTEMRHRIMLNVTFGPQTKAATGAMNAAANTWDQNMALNDWNTWDLCVFLHNPSVTDAFNRSYEEFGVKEYATIFTAGNPGGSAPPGAMNHQLPNSCKIHYSVNTNYTVRISITDLHLNGNLADTNKIPAQNMTILNNHTLAPGNSEIFEMRAFAGPNIALYIWNSTGHNNISAPLNGLQSAGPGYSDYSVGFDPLLFEATEVVWWVSVPGGLPEGIYRATITLTIGN
ncbi:MAG: GLUG motif-containing protein [Thermoplasmata archaeon]